MHARTHPHLDLCTQQTDSFLFTFVSLPFTGKKYTKESVCITNTHENILSRKENIVRLDKATSNGSTARLNFIECHFLYGIINGVNFMPANFVNRWKSP